MDVQLEIDPDLAVSETTIEVRDEAGALVAVPNPLGPASLHVPLAGRHV